VLPNIEASEEALRKEVEKILFFLPGGMVPLEDDDPREEEGGL
jgi:hypothetical protein